MLKILIIEKNSVIHEKRFYIAYFSILIQFSCCYCCFLTKILSSQMIIYAYTIYDRIRVAHNTYVHRKKMFFQRHTMWYSTGFHKNTKI